jgi:hypothetical protein
MPNWGGEAALARETAAKAMLRQTEARLATRKPKARVQHDVRAFPPWLPPGAVPMLGQQSRDWHGHSLVWVGTHFEPVSARLLLDLLNLYGVTTDQSLSGRGRPAAPLSVSLVDGTAYV